MQRNDLQLQYCSQLLLVMTPEKPKLALPK